MRRRAWTWIAFGAFLFHGGLATAQDSLKALEEELNEAKQQHEDVTTQTLTNFFTQVDAAMASPDAAIALYQQAGGTMPDPSPVVKANEEETATERAAREARDQANLTKLGVALELHCGLMHFGALFVTKPDQKGLQDDWVAWLKSAAQLYPQLAEPQQTGAPPPEEPHKKKRDRGGAVAGPASPYFPGDIKAKSLQDSIISKYLGFHLWQDKEQGGWAVQGIPKLYRTNVLEPLRTTPTEGTLAAWDVYIAMVNADEPDNDKWNQVDFPPLQFDRACDDYSVTPSTEKLETLVNLIKANPTFPKVDDWISRTHQLMDDYRARRGGAAPVVQTPATPAASSSTNPNVIVTTVQEGDATIITTRTNSAASNQPPAH